MDYFNYAQGELFAEDVPVKDIAEQFGTPTYIYSRATLERHYQVIDEALAGIKHRVCYAVKANSNLAVLNVLARLGSGFDIVSGGELERVLAAKGDPSKVVFSGVGKLKSEMRRALEVGIYCFNVESEAELYTLNEVAGELNKKAPISLRINPDVDAKSHPYIVTGLKDNKFGIDIALALPLYLRAQQLPHLTIVGVDCHIGSQLLELDPFLAALSRLLRLVDELKTNGIHIKHLDLGGGLGVPYRDERPPEPAEYAQALKQAMKNYDLEIVVEPGRVIAANSGVLLTRAINLKHNQYKNFAIVDGAMNDLLRPALYSAWQQIITVKQFPDADSKIYDVVGPVCETSDFLGKERQLALKENDLLVVRSSGAYGFVMSSNYNTRPRAAEVMVDGDQVFEVKPRENVKDLFANETLLPE